VSPHKPHSAAGDRQMENSPAHGIFTATLMGLLFWGTVLMVAL
jgi:hypothetical protein